MNKNSGLGTFSLSFCLFFAGVVCAQSPSRWKAHDLNRPRPPIVKPAALSLPVPAPADAVILFDGQDLTQWRSQEGGPAKWIVSAGYMESVKDSGYIYTRQNFGDMQLHVEWAAPTPPEGVSQHRGNSGVFLMGLYEIQVLDSFQNDTYPDGQAAAVYGQYPPLVNACLPPGKWQAYDIVFRRPRFSPEGRLLEPARVTVLHNGLLVQDNVKIWGPTSWLQYTPYSPQPDRLPIALQDHGNPVRYRNIWLRELPETLDPGPSSQKPEPIITLLPAELDRYVGKYQPDAGGSYTISLEGSQLKANFYGSVYIDLVPHSATRFSLRWTAATLTFSLDAGGAVRNATMKIGGESREARKIQ